MYHLAHDPFLAATVYARHRSPLFTLDRHWARSSRSARSISSSSSRTRARPWSLGRRRWLQGGHSVSGGCHKGRPRLAAVSPSIRFAHLLQKSCDVVTASPSRELTHLFVFAFVQEILGILARPLVGESRRWGSGFFSESGLQSVREAHQQAG